MESSSNSEKREFNIVSILKPDHKIWNLFWIFKIGFHSIFILGISSRTREWLLVSLLVYISTEKNMWVYRQMHTCCTATSQILAKQLNRYYCSVSVLNKRARCVCVCGDVEMGETKTFFNSHKVLQIVNQ